jgi:hypothetical protein
MLWVVLTIVVVSALVVTAYGLLRSHGSTAQPRPAPAPWRATVAEDVARSSAAVGGTEACDRYSVLLRMGPGSGVGSGRPRRAAALAPALGEWVCARR